MCKITNLSEIGSLMEKAWKRMHPGQALAVLVSSSVSEMYIVAPTQLCQNPARQEAGGRMVQSKALRSAQHRGGGHAYALDQGCMRCSAPPREHAWDRRGCPQGAPGIFKPIFDMGRQVKEDVP